MTCNETSLLFQKRIKRCLGTTRTELIYSINHIHRIPDGVIECHGLTQRCFGVFRLIPILSYLPPLEALGGIGRLLNGWYSIIYCLKKSPLVGKRTFSHKRWDRRYKKNVIYGVFTRLDSIESAYNEALYLVYCQQHGTWLVMHINIVTAEIQ